MGPESLDHLEIWQASMDVVEVVYGFTRGWPKEEQFGLTIQTRRAAVSIPANIAEGVGRGTAPEAARFGQIARGSLYELQTLLAIAKRVGYSPIDDADCLRRKLSKLARALSGFIRYNQTKQSARRSSE